MYDVISVFDAAIGDLGFAMNQDGSTDDVTEGVSCWTFVDDIRPADIQQTNHLTLMLNYNVEFIRGSISTLTGAQRKKAAATDFQNIIQTIYSNITLSGAENVVMIDGSYSPNTNKEYQTYANIVWELMIKIPLN
jgi:hypothetical protein